MNTNQELHVIFGAGPLGKWTARELVKLGRRVRMINRSGQVAGVPAEWKPSRATPTMWPATPS